MRLYKAIVAGALTATAAAGTAVALPALSETAANAASGPGVTVNLWNWNWKSVARECTDVLGPAGYGSVQVSRLPTPCPRAARSGGTSTSPPATR